MVAGPCLFAILHNIFRQKWCLLKYYNNGGWTFLIRHITQSFFDKNGGPRFKT